MSEEEKISKESIGKTVGVVGELYPLLVNQDGKRLDGDHRAEWNPGWHTKTVQTKNRLEEIVVRLTAHHRRRVPKTETQTLVLEAAEELEKSGVEKTKVSTELARLLPYEDSYIRELLPNKYKEPGKVAAARLTEHPSWKKCEFCGTNTFEPQSFQNHTLCPECLKKAMINSEPFLHKFGILNHNKKVLEKKKVSDDQLSNLIACGKCGRSIGIVNAKAFEFEEGKPVDLCPNCYDKAVHSKAERSERVHPRVGAFEDVVRLAYEGRGIPKGLQNEFITLPFRFGDDVWYLPQGVLALRLNGKKAHEKRGDKDKKIVEALETLGVRVLDYTYENGSDKEKDEVLGLLEDKLKELGWKR
jgi:hypothetical protein